MRGRLPTCIRARLRAPHYVTGRIKCADAAIKAALLTGYPKVEYLICTRKCRILRRLYPSHQDCDMPCDHRLSSTVIDRSPPEFALRPARGANGRVPDVELQETTSCPW